MASNIHIHLSYYQAVKCCKPENIFTGEVGCGALGFFLYFHVMAIVTIETPFNIDLEFKIATVGKRALAWLVDMVIICLYYYVMLRLIYPTFRMGEATESTAAIFLIILPVLLYQLLSEIFMNGQTLGKKAAGIKVIDREGHEPSWGQYTIRWILSIGNLFLYIVPYLILLSPIAMIFFMILYLPDFLCMVISPKGQRIGDHAAGTVVIDANYQANINETIYLEVEHTNYEPLFPQVMRLSDRDINGIRNLLNVKTQSADNTNYTIEVAQKIKRVLGIESDLYPTDFLEQLLKDYNYITAKNA